MLPKLAGAIRRTLGIINSMMRDANKDDEVILFKFIGQMADLQEHFGITDLMVWDDPSVQEINRLREEVKTLKFEITKMRVNLEHKNHELDAMNYVWCDGGCPLGVHRYDGMGGKGVTRAMVETAIRNTERLVTWYRNYHWKPQWASLDIDMKKAFYEAWERAQKAERELAELGGMKIFRTKEERERDWDLEAIKERGRCLEFVRR